MKKSRINKYLCAWLFFVMAGCWINTIKSYAQSSPKKTEVQQGKLYLIPLPALGYNPVTGFIFGVAASASISIGDPVDTHLSSGMFTATYTSKQQLLMTLKSTAYTPKNEFMLMGDWRLLLSSQPTYGLGTGPQNHILLSESQDDFLLGDYKDGVDEGELMEFNLLRLHETVLREVKDGFYIGVGYHFDKYWNIQDDLLDLASDPPIITNHYAYSLLHGFDPKGYTISGPSINLAYDTRDNINNPYSGRYAFMQFKTLPSWLGSSKSATVLWLEYREYLSLSKKNPRNLLAFWTYFNLTTSGRLPYMGLPALGWDQMGRSGRGYPQGRFRGEQIFYFETEYRFRIPLIRKFPDLVGGVIFTNVTSASASDLKVKLFEYFTPGFGVGLRFMLQPATRSNVTFDYGYGTDQKGAFYFNMKEYY